MGKSLIERIGDMFRLEYIITEASLMTRNIKLRLILMNWMCLVALDTYELDVFFIAGLGGFAPPAKNWQVWGAAPPAPKPKNFVFFEFFEQKFGKSNFTSNF